MNEMERDDLVYMARLAEQAERYEDMVNYVKLVAKADQELSIEERNLLSVAFKNYIGGRRASWRVVSSIEEKARSKPNLTSQEWQIRIDRIIAYRERIEAELEAACLEVIGLIKDNLLTNLSESSGAESRAFFLKMCGDYYRYLAEFKQNEDREKVGNLASESYLAAKEVVEDPANGLKPTDPIRLGLALNLSVFYYEILEKQEEACEIAKKAFDRAIAELDSLNEDSYKDATLIMQLLRDNLTLWTTDDGEEGEGKA